MTTRKELLGHVRAAIEDDLNRQDAALNCESTWLDFDLNEAAFAAIEAVYKAIGDHQLAVMIGDRSTDEQLETISKAQEVAKFGGIRHVTDEVRAEGFEMLQDDDDAE